MATASRIRSKMSEGDTVQKDASRPFFKRQEGEIGIYINIYEAKAVNPNAYGSEHFYYMNLMEMLHKYFEESDIVKYRTHLDKRGLFKGSYLERFEKGIVLAVGFDGVDELENLWKLCQNDKLTQIMQETLVTQALLKRVDATKIVLAIRMFEDEYSNCKNELLSRKLQRLTIKSKDQDMVILDRVKKFQDKFNIEVQDVKEMETKFGQKLAEFLMKLKQILPGNLRSINTVKEFETMIKVSKGTNAKKMEIVDTYIDIIKKWTSLFREVDEHVCMPILQVHSVYENEKQRDLKLKIRSECKNIQEKLKPDVNLQNISHPGWSKRLLKSEHALYLGLISLVPLGSEAAFEINCNLDEYLNDFPHLQ